MTKAPLRKESCASPSSGWSTYPSVLLIGSDVSRHPPRRCGSVTSEFFALYVWFLGLRGVARASRPNPRGRPGWTVRRGDIIRIERTQRGVRFDADRPLRGSAPIVPGRFLREVASLGICCRETGASLRGDPEPPVQGGPNLQAPFAFA